MLRRERLLGREGRASAREEHPPLCGAPHSWSPPPPLSTHSLHRQLTNPVIPFRLYDAFISLAKTLHADPGDDPGDPRPRPDVVHSLKTLLGQLPDSNYNTLRHVVAHLFRCALGPPPRLSHC